MKLNVSLGSETFNQAEVTSFFQLSPVSLASTIYLQQHSLSPLFSSVNVSGSLIELKLTAVRSSFQQFNSGHNSVVNSVRFVQTPPSSQFTPEVTPKLAIGQSSVFENAANAPEGLPRVVFTNQRPPVQKI